MTRTGLLLMAIGLTGALASALAGVSNLAALIATAAGGLLILITPDSKESS